MLTIISPAKRINKNIKGNNKIYSEPIFLKEASQLMKVLKKLSPEKIGKLQDVNNEIAQENFERNQQWLLPFTKENATEAILAFQGDVYRKIEAWMMSNEELEFAQNNLVILSGLYGVLKPLDIIMPYRLEMGTKISSLTGKTLYQFWGDKLTNYLNNNYFHKKHKVLINLSSTEYFKAINTKKLATRVITPVFKDFKNGQLKILFMYAKQARGMMLNYIIKNRIEEPEDLKAFNMEGYVYDENLSLEDEWVFTR